jgi:ATP synthase protein I
MSDKDTQGRGGTPQDPSGGDFSERLRRLDTALKKAQADRTDGDEHSPRPSKSVEGMAQALRLASEFAAGVIVGGGIGWVFDWAFGLSPWGLIVFLLLGFVAGVLNILRSSGLMKKPGERE